MKVAVIGATGAVGRAVVAILKQRKFPTRELVLFASKKSAGKKIGRNTVKALTANQDFGGIDVAFFCAGSQVSETHVWRAAAAGALSIDNASVFRMNDKVPLVIPEVNAEAIESARATRVIANPNCTTVQLVMALKPLHDRYGIKRVQVASYQAVSGKGQKGIDEFHRQVKGGRGSRSKSAAFPHPIAFNCIPQIDRFAEDDFTGEEWKVMRETRKILGDESIRVVATCVRVPVVNAHSEVVTIETAAPVSCDEAREAFAAMPGVKVIDDPARESYPLAMKADGCDEICVGRIRNDLSLADPRHGLTFWVVGDNLRKGAALNAVQIAEAALAKGLLRR